MVIVTMGNQVWSKQCGPSSNLTNNVVNFVQLNIVKFAMSTCMYSGEKAILVIVINVILNDNIYDI